MSRELRPAFHWWVEVLESGFHEKHEWHSAGGQNVQLLCDASEAPAYLGAVALVGDQCYYTYFAPPAYLFGMVRRRRNKQVIGFELLFMSLGLSTLAELILGCNVGVHSDSTGSVCNSCACICSQSAFRRGACTVGAISWRMLTTQLVGSTLLVSWKQNSTLVWGLRTRAMQRPRWVGCVFV